MTVDIAIRSKKIFQYPLISGGLESVLSQTEKSCIALYNIQFSTNIKIYNYKIKINLISRPFIDTKVCMIGLM